MRPATLLDLASARGTAVPEVRAFKGFAAFADRYVAACDLIAGEEDLRRLVREIVEDAAEDGVVWLEPAFYSPRYRRVFGSDRETIEIVLDELKQAGGDLGVGTGLILAADRTVDPDEAVELARLASGYAGQGVIGFGLANDETGRPPEPFAPAFAVARDAGLLSVPHGGELAGPESVIGCLDACGADRVMHGVRSVEDPELLARLAGEGIYLDVCPSSNVALSVVASIDEHPLPTLIDAGVRCTLNADDPLLFGPGVAEEYRLCRDQLGFDDALLARIATWSLEGSAAPADLVRQAQEQTAAWLAG